MTSYNVCPFTLHVLETGDPENAQKFGTKVLRTQLISQINLQWSHSQELHLQTSVPELHEHTKHMSLILVPMPWHTR